MSSSSYADAMKRTRPEAPSLDEIPPVPSSSMTGPSRNPGPARRGAPISNFQPRRQHQQQQSSRQQDQQQGQYQPQHRQQQQQGQHQPQQRQPQQQQQYRPRKAAWAGQVDNDSVNGVMIGTTLPSPPPSSTPQSRLNPAARTWSKPAAGNQTKSYANSSTSASAFAGSAWTTVGTGTDASRQGPASLTDPPPRVPDQLSSPPHQQSMQRSTNAWNRTKLSTTTATRSSPNENTKTNNGKGSTQSPNSSAAPIARKKGETGKSDDARPPKTMASSKKSKQKQSKRMSMSIADLIKDSNRVEKGNSRFDGEKRNKSRQLNTTQERQQLSERGVALQVDSVQEFPSLAATASSSVSMSSSNRPESTSTSDPTGISPSPAWGVVQRQQPQPPPSDSKPQPMPQSSISHSNTKSSGKNNFKPPSKILQRGEPLLSLRQDVDGSSNEISKTVPGGSSSSNNNNAKGSRSGSSNSTKRKKDGNPTTPQTPSATAGAVSVKTIPTSSVRDIFTPLARPNINGDGTFLSTPGGILTSGVGGSHSLLDGDEHKLLRLMQERTVYQKKGRQRVAPRKKKFTPLKKKVLQERLARWRSLHPEESAVGNVEGKANAASAPNHDASVPSASLCVYGYARPDELEDDDEYDEIVENLRAMAARIGRVDEILIPRTLWNEESGGEHNNDNFHAGTAHPAFVKFEKETDASAAKACWNGLLVGGSKLEVVCLDVSSPDNGGGDEAIPWTQRVVAAEARRRTLPTSDSSRADVVGPVEIIIEKVLTDDDYEDEDCMAESLTDLKKVAQEFGEVMVVQPTDAKDGNVALTYECSLSQARDIAVGLCRTVVGGESLHAFVNESALDAPAKKSSTSILLENILTEDDLEDEECMSEALNDIKQLSLKYGNVSGVAVKGRGVVVTYDGGFDVAERAVGELDGFLLGGNVVAASLFSDQSTQINADANDSCILLHNLLTQEDLEDEDCLEESLTDVRELASKYGVIYSIDLMKADDATSIRIRFDGAASVAAEAVKGFDGMVIGGQIVSATLPGVEERATQTYAAATELSGDKRKPINEETTSLANEKKARTDDKSPLYSGDRLIPERFAEMKRVPKVPNQPGPREYATIVNDERVKPLLTEMLSELMRLQKRAIEEKNTKVRRRIVMGLREVARGIRSHKVKMVVMANNLDEYGVIDDKLQEIIDLAKSEGVPLFFEFTKRTLGKALGKTIKIAVVGIQNAEGAHQPFKKLNAIAGVV